MTNLIVYKDNQITEASYKLTLIEQRIILFCIAKVNPLDKENFEKQKEQTIYVDDFLKMFSDLDRKIVYKQIKDAVNHLYDRSIVVKKPRHTKTFRWIQSKDYYDQEGKAIIKFSDAVMPYLADLKGQFTKYQLRNISAFKRTYSIRLYELLVQYRSKGLRSFNIAELKEILMIGDKFKRYDLFRTKVIEPALEEINEKSDLIVTFEPIRSGRKIEFLKFNIKIKKNIKEKELSAHIEHLKSVIKK